MNQDDEDGGMGKLDLANLLELMEFAKGGMRKDLAQRYGKGSADMGDSGSGDMSAMGDMGDESESPQEESAEAAIPGVEEAEDAGGPDGAAMDAAGSDPMKLKAALLKMKMKAG